MSGGRGESGAIPEPAPLDFQHRNVVDALPPLAAGQMCSIDDRRSYRSATSLHVNRRGGGRARISLVAQAVL